MNQILRKKITYTTIVFLSLLIVSSIGLFYVKQLGYFPIILIVLFVFWWIIVRNIAKNSSKNNVNKKDLNGVASELIHIIGKDNIVSISHCSTRVLFNVNDSQSIDIDKLREVGFVGILRPSNQKIQIISKELTQDLYIEVSKIKEQNN